MQSNQSICWFDSVWLGQNELTVFNVLEYFKGSPFYAAPEKHEEYLLVEKQEPHLYVIRKLKQVGDKKVTSAYFYVLDQVIFQAPTLEAVLKARMERCRYNLKALFTSAQELYDPCAKRSAQEHLSGDDQGSKDADQQHTVISERCWAIKNIVRATCIKHRKPPTTTASALSGQEKD